MGAGSEAGDALTLSEVVEEVVLPGRISVAFTEWIIAEAVVVGEFLKATSAELLLLLSMPGAVVGEEASRKRKLGEDSSSWSVSRSATRAPPCLSHLLKEDLVFISLNENFSKTRRSGSMPGKTEAKKEESFHFSHPMASDLISTNIALCASSRTREALHSVTRALVISRVDYFNILYMGITLKYIQKFQLVQNAAA